MECNYLALDLVLKALKLSTDFDVSDDKIWTSIARLVPGSTARQCQKRFEDLSMELDNSKCLTDRVMLGDMAPRNPSTETVETMKGKSTNNSKNTDTGSPLIDNGVKPRYNPIMVIHVCDEAKNLKQDFTCPRDLLVREMKYFGEYLSTDAQHMEEVDISVHCDVQIFDWLIKYVKRSTRDVPVAPTLEPSNVISILISSDFLQMDALVQECIDFCHCNMSSIISTPCNMNCIDDRLVARIAELFNHNELEDIKDRKDKFKSKLYAKQVERLFESNHGSCWSPENASTLYRCSVCKKILTKNLENKIKCLQNRMSIDRHGGLSYRHVFDSTFDVGDYILDLKNQKSWGDVYWQLWGTINYLVCSRCGETFPCSELASCRYHPEFAVFDSSSTGNKRSVGEYPCCGLKVGRFDPTQYNKGCRVKDHQVIISSNQASEPSQTACCLFANGNVNKDQVYRDLLLHRDAVCIQHQRVVTVCLPSENVELDIFGADEIACGLRGDICHWPPGSDIFVKDNKSEPLLKPLLVEREVTYDEKSDDSGDDEVGDDEESRVKKLRAKKSKVTIDPQAILLDAPDFSTTKDGKWDISRSLRYNQDAQREEDQRRMRDIIKYLTRLRLNHEKLDRLKQREYAGGIFSKLEAQWKSVYTPPPRLNNPAFRNKPRLNQLPITK